MPTTLIDIEQAARDYSKDARELRNLQEGLDDAMMKVRTSFMDEIIPVAKKAAESKKLLELLVAESQALFEKPKTRTIADVKVGFVKQKGKIEIPNEKGTIALIRANYKDIATTAIKVTETLVKDVLCNLSGDTLKKLSVTITADTDAPIVKLTDTNVQKIIDAILAEQAKMAE